MVLLVTLVGIAAWAAGRALSTRDGATVAKTFEKKKTICVGRFLIDVPVNAELSLSHEMMDGFDIETAEESEAVFRERMAAREAEIDAAGVRTDSRGPSGIVEARDLQIPGMVGRVLIYGRTRSYSMEGDRRIDDEWMSIEAHVHLNGQSFALSMKYADPPDAQAAVALLARLRLRGADEIPSAPGFCISRGVFADPLPPHKTEHVVMHLGLPGHSDMGLAFSSDPGGRTDDGLLARVAVTDAEASPDEKLRVTKLRSGKRNINGALGEEELERVRELNFTTGYSFMWEAPGVAGDLLQPHLELDMVTGSNPRPGGVPVGSSMHEDAALALWESISSSIRLRPVTPPDGRPATHTPPARDFDPM